MARKIFYNRRSRRRMMAVVGICVVATALFSAGVYTGKTYPTLFSLAPLAPATHAAAPVAPPVVSVSLTAAEF